MIETTFGNVALFGISIDRAVAHPDLRELRFFGQEPDNITLTVRVSPERRKAAITVTAAKRLDVPGSFAVGLSELRATVDKILGVVAKSVTGAGAATKLESVADSGAARGKRGQLSLF